MSISPKVSILMPVYNSEKYLAQAVESILNQTFTDFELIIVNDGSTDKSLEILKSLAIKDKRICLMSQENKGIAVTRNRMLQKAQGDLIAVMDSDDIALPQRIAYQVEFLDNNPNTVCVGGAFELVDEKGRLLTCLHPATDNQKIQESMLKGHTCIHHACVMYRRISALKVGNYAESFTTVGDLDFFLRLGEIGDLANMEEILYKYRLHSKSISESKQIQQTQDKIEACERAWKRRGIQGHFEATEPWRPGLDRISQHQFMLKYGWWAFNSRQRKTAVIYALKSIQALPFKRKGWKLLACSMFKPLPNYQK